jgi:hypothetical protein
MSFWRQSTTYLPARAMARSVFGWFFVWFLLCTLFFVGVLAPHKFDYRLFIGQVVGTLLVGYVGERLLLLEPVGRNRTTSV